MSRRMYGTSPSRVAKLRSTVGGSGMSAAKSGSWGTALDIAEEEGFDRTAARAALASEELAHKVRAEERAAWDLNITGVPAMVVENKFMIPGAQPAEAYADALRRVAEKTAA